MSRLSFAVPLSETRHLLVPSFLITGFLLSLPMVGAFDLSVNTNVSRHSVMIPSSSRFAPVGHVGGDLCHPPKLTTIDGSDTGARIHSAPPIQATLPTGNSPSHTIAR